jgi:hypothetical protein
MGFAITLTDASVELAGAADGYAPEGPLTTFYRAAPGRSPRLDPWAERILSVRTDRIVLIRALDAAA